MTPNAQELERLALLAEECAEVIQAIQKIVRRGWLSYDPTLAAAQQITNRAHLEKEMGHLEFALNLMVESDDIYAENVWRAADEKGATIAKWLHHQPKELLAMARGIPLRRSADPG